MWSDYKTCSNTKLPVVSYRRIFGLPSWSCVSTVYVMHNIANMEAMIRELDYGFIL